MEANPFTEQVRLLVALLPSVAKQPCFALKGGAAARRPVEDAQSGAHESGQAQAGCSQAGECSLHIGEK